MNILSTIKRSFSVLAVTVLIFSIFAGIATNSAQAISNGPSFNSGYFDHSTLGNNQDEGNFVRLGAKGDQGESVSICRDGAEVKVWFYVHNHVSSNHNGTDLDGSAVATDTTVKLQTAGTQYQNSHKLRGYIDSDQTNPISDTVTVKCNTKKIALSLSNLSADRLGSSADDKASWGAYKLWGDSINSKAQIGYEGGKMPGCWEYRMIMVYTFKVRVQPKPTPITNPKPTPVTNPKPTPVTNPKPTPVTPGDTNQNTNTVNGGDSNSNADAEVGDIDVHGGDIDVDVDGGDSNSHANNDNYNEVNNNNVNNNDNSNVNNVNVHVTVNNTGSANSPGGGKHGPVVGKGNPQAKPKHLPDTGVNLTFAFLAVVVAATIAHRHFKLRLARR